MRTTTVPSAADYEAAFERLHSRMGSHHWRMLDALAQAQDHTLSTSDLAGVLGYDDIAGVNIHLGKLGRLLAGELDFRPDTRADGSPIWTTSLAAGFYPDGNLNNSGWRWTLRPEVVEVLRRLRVRGGSDAKLATQLANPAPARPPSFNEIWNLIRAISPGTEILPWTREGRHRRDTFTLVAVSHSSIAISAPTINHGQEPRSVSRSDVEGFYSYWSDYLAGTLPRSHLGNSFNSRYIISLLAHVTGTPVIGGMPTSVVMSSATAKST